MKFLLLLPLLLLMGCRKDTTKTVLLNPKEKIKTTTEIAVTMDSAKPVDSVSEIFIDSTHIGIKGKYKLELKRVIGKDSVYTDIRFFFKENGKWLEKQHFAFEHDDSASRRPEYKDFNNDGYNDFTYVPLIAARGANEVRSLFIFDPKLSSLRYMKNSTNYPNLRYNKKLDCVYAFAVYGGSSTHFLKIEKDSLRTFASVTLLDGYREIYKTDKKGKETLIKREPFETSYQRYKNFDPLEEDEDF